MLADARGDQIPTSPGCAVLLRYEILYGLGSLDFHQKKNQPPPGGKWHRFISEERLSMFCFGGLILGVKRLHDHCLFDLHPDL